MLSGIRASEQLVRLARTDVRGELGVRHRVLRAARLEIRVAEAESKIGREDLGLRDGRLVRRDGFVVAARLDEDLAELRPDVAEPRVAVEQRAQRGRGIVVP